MGRESYMTVSVEQTKSKLAKRSMPLKKSCYKDDELKST